MTLDEEVINYKVVVLIEIYIFGFGRFGIRGRLAIIFSAYIL